MRYGVRRMRADDRLVDPFEADVAANEGYVYSTNARLSSVFSNRRMTDAVLAAVELRDKRVVDIGCGDGTYTVELAELGGAASVVGVDPAAGAIDVAKRRGAPAHVSFETGSAYALRFEPDSFDIAHLRGVLHHMDDPIAALREALRIAATIVVVEPNGYNLGLKLIERISTYHREHHEKSYAPRTLDRWVRALGGEIVSRQWIGLVPMFSPDPLAKTLKLLERPLEHLPLLRAAGCAQYVFTAVRTGPSVLWLDPS